MNRLFRYLTTLTVLVGLLHVPCFADAPPKALFYNDFESLPEGDVPGDIQILSGSFTIKKNDGNTVMELPGEPLDGFGVLYGPPEAPAASARIFATNTAKRFPEFGVGLGDSAGPRIWVMPAIGQLQITKGDDVLAQIPFTWKSGTWTRLKVQAHKLPDGSIAIEGKAWLDGEKEPEMWMITAKAPEAVMGRASVWGTPYGGTPMRFDDIAVIPAEE